MDNRRMCPNCRAFVTTADKVCPYCEMQLGQRAVERRNPADILGGLIPHARFTTVVILLINAGIYLADRIPGLQAGFNGVTLADAGAKVGPYILAGQWWRLITAGFLHGNNLHIIMNLWVLFDLGSAVEETYGTSRYLFFYFISTITGFLASLFWSPLTPSVGASAAIFGLLGTMVAFGVRDKSSYGAAVRAHYTQWAVYGFLFGVLPSLLPGIFGFAVDNAAHAGGFVGGFAVAYLAGTPGYTRFTEQIWKGASALAVAITALAFFYMFRALMMANTR